MSFKIYSIEAVEPVSENLAKYMTRSFDGSANNLIDPSRGKNNIKLLRKAEASYDSEEKIALRGASNPSPRLISNEICKGDSPENNMNLTDMVWVWGQFVDHEIDLTPEQSSDPETLPISTDDGGDEEDYPGRTINFTRSQFETINETRQQPNVISCFIDATNVYGSTVERAYALRLMDGTGKLKTTTADNNEVLPPYNTDNLDNAMSTSSAFFVAGDVRANENIALLGMHTIFIREHNRLCDIIGSNSAFTGKDELIYQKARRIICGMMQKITYTEYLPALLGSFSIDSTYDETIDPSIMTEFSTVGYRFGHTMLSSNLQVGADSSSTVQLRNVFFNPSYAQSNGVNNILLGASKKRMQEIDGIIVEDVRSFLFGAPTSTTMLDLASLNIQRGRDHGIPDYNTVRVAYGLSRLSSFSQIPTTSANITKLESLYDDVNSIDPWVGAIVETHVSGKAVGPLINAILTDQFTRLRDGDRFWYTRDIGITTNDLALINGTTLGQILTRNTGLTFSNDVFHI